MRAPIWTRRLISFSEISASRSRAHVTTPCWVDAIRAILCSTVLSHRPIRAVRQDGDEIRPHGGPVGGAGTAAGARPRAAGAGRARHARPGAAGARRGLGDGRGEARATVGATGGAEREGFEPSGELSAPYSLSRRVPSAARPPLREDLDSMRR